MAPANDSAEKEKLDCLIPSLSLRGKLAHSPEYYIRSPKWLWEGVTGISRTLGQISQDERTQIIRAIHKEAQEANWSRLDNRTKGNYYRKWENEYNLTHATVKDRIMKGFDAAQSIPPSGEAAVQAELKPLLENYFPYVDSRVPVWEGKRQVDFIAGVSQRILTNVIELESVTTWDNGLIQVLLYKSDYFRRTGMQALPTLILFGDCTGQLFRQIQETCADQRVLLLGYRLKVDRELPDCSLERLLEEEPGV